MPPERRAPPRVVPTLTAVVEPWARAPLASSAPVAELPLGGPSAPPLKEEVDTLVQAVMARLDGPLAQGLQARVEQLVAEQSALLTRRLRAELEPLVRDIVTAELARRSGAAGR